MKRGTRYILAFAGCDPVPLSRPRFDSRSRRTYTNARSEKGARAQAALLAPHTPREPLAGPLAVGLSYVLPLPKRGRAPGPHHVTPDVDNLSKLTLDVLSRLRWWNDDAQVAELHATKRWGANGENPGVVVEVWSLA